MSCLPRVATTLKRPLATRSISSSICCSVDEGELRIVYVDVGMGGVTGFWVVGGTVGEGCTAGGRRENNEGDGAMKDRYWSITCNYSVKKKIRMFEPIKRTSFTNSPVPSRATKPASSSNKARGRGSTKLKWKDSYKDLSRSSAIRRMLAEVGEIK